MLFKEKNEMRKSEMKDEEERSLFRFVFELKTKSIQGKQCHHYYKPNKKYRYKR